MSGDPVPRDAELRSTLVALSDTKLLLGYHYGEWTFGPPAIEAGIAACSMAQEEFGHTRLLNGILKREFELEIDPLADQRPPDAFASIAFLDHPLESWAELVAANAVVDLALSLLLSSFEDGDYQPLARAVPKMLLEERFHTEHAEGWVRVIESGEAAPRDALARALERALRDVAAFFGPAGHDEDLVRSGARTADDEALRGRLFARIAGLLADPAAVGLRREGDGWSLIEPLNWADWDAERRRLSAGGPDQGMLDELRGTKNVAFKSA
ncbi:MAG TPA: Phenylacetic acid catabolic protein [Gemmatimonadota bacterium]|nr:Phenylacetic acid catabolic protein [Gemmatimonadota bacterium]